MAPGANGTRPRQVLHANAKEGLADGINELSIRRSGKRERQNLRLHTDYTADLQMPPKQLFLRFKLNVRYVVCLMTTGCSKQLAPNQMYIQRQFCSVKHIDRVMNTAFNVTQIKLQSPNEERIHSILTFFE